MTNNHNEAMEIIDLFLENWKAAAMKHYINLREEYLNMIENNHEINLENLKLIRKPVRDGFIYPYRDNAQDIIDNFDSLDENEKRTIQKEINSAVKKNYRSNQSKKDYNLITEDFFRLDEMLEKEKTNKKKQLIAKVEKKAGKIINASHLKMGHDGSINGYITGEIKTVEVETIFAGGYNIQCLHYRLLVK